MAKLPSAKQTTLTDAFAAQTKTRALRTEPNPQYPKPTVVEAPNDVLDPSVADPAGITVKVGYDLMVTSDRIKVTFNGYVFAPIGGSADGEVQLSVPAAQVAATVGKHVEVSYSVVRPSGSIISMPLDLEVQTMPAASLPAPEITQAQDGVLDLTAFTGAAKLTVKKWPLCITGQRVWLTVSGPGGVPSLNILNGYPISDSEAAGEIARDIARSELEKYADGDVMTVLCKVTFDGSTEEGLATMLPLLTLAVAAGPETTLETFEGVSQQTVPYGQTLDLESMEILAVSDNFSIVEHPSTWGQPWVIKHALSLRGTIDITLKRSARTVRFGYITEFAGTPVSYYDDQNQPMGSFELPTAGFGAWHEYQGVPGRRIHKLTITRPTTVVSILLDNFTLTR